MSNLTLPVTLAGLTDVLDVLAPKAGNSNVAKTSPDNFLSLLNAGGKTKEIDAKPSKDDDNSDNTPVAVEVSAPIVQVKHTPAVHQESDVSNVIVRRQDVPAADETTVPSDAAGKVSQPKAPAHSSGDATTDKQATPADNTAEGEAPTVESTAAAVTQTAPAEDAAPVEDVRPALAQKIENIRQMLQVIVSAFSSLGVANTQPQAAASITGPVDSPIAGPVTTAQASADNAQIKPELASLQNIVDVLQKMQQALTLTDDAQGTAAATLDASNDLQSLTQQLQTHLDVLSKLLHAAAEMSDQNRGGLISILLQQTQVTTVTVAVSESETLTLTPQDLIGNLRDGIASLRDQLKQLQAKNNTQITRNEQQIKQQFGDITQLFKDALASAGMTLADSPTNDNNPAAPVNVNAAAQQAAAVPPAPIVTVQAAPVAVAIDTVQKPSQEGGAQNQQGGNSGQQQSAAQSIAPAGQSSLPQSASNAQGASFARALDQQQQTHKPVAEQVTFHIRTAIADGSSKIRIQLSPEDLGKLEIKLHVGADGKTGVAITADNKAALEMLQRDVQGLARALADAGLSTDSGSLNFNLRGGQQEQGQNAQAAASYQGAQPDEDDDITPNVLTRSYVVNLAEGLDIKI